MNTNQLEEEVKELTRASFPHYGKNGVYTTEQFVEARNAYHTEKHKLEVKWKQWLGDEYASSMKTRVQNVIYDQAWEDGHSSGYHDIENKYIDHAALVDRVLEYM